jgi:hypothetical protein
MTTPADQPPTKADRSGSVGRPSRDRNAAATTNDPTARWDLTTASGKRNRDLYKAFARQIGNPSDVATRALLIAAAEGVVIAETIRDKVMSGDRTVTINDLVRAENMANRALRRLKLDKAAPPGPKKSFAEKIAEREAAARLAEAAKQEPAS